MKTSLLALVMTCSTLSIGCRTKPAVVPRPPVVTVEAPPPLVCRSIPGRPSAPRLADRSRVVAPGSYRRLAADGTPDGATFEVLPVESYLVHRSVIVDVGAYFGEVGDAWDVVEACQRALGLLGPPPSIETPRDSFAPPAPTVDCPGDNGRDANGDCMDAPAGWARPGAP